MVTGQRFDGFWFKRPMPWSGRAMDTEGLPAWRPSPPRSLPLSSSRDRIQLATDNEKASPFLRNLRRCPARTTGGVARMLHRRRGLSLARGWASLLDKGSGELGLVRGPPDELILKEGEVGDR